MLRTGVFEHRSRRKFEATPHGTAIFDSGMNFLVNSRSSKNGVHVYSLPSACSAEEELASDGLLLSAGLLESERKLMQPGVARLQKRACKLKEQRAVKPVVRLPIRPCGPLVQSVHVPLALHACKN